MRVLLIAMSLAGFSGLGAEEQASDWFVRSWQTEDGLPDNSVSGVEQGPDGYLWVGTNGGLMRFNGNDFSPLPLHSIPDLPSRQVRTMFLDRLGRIWIAMERGPVIRLDERSLHAFTQEDGIIDNVAKSMTDDAEGRMWVAYPNGVCRIEDDEVTQLGRAEGIPTGSHANLTCDPAGQVYFSIGGKFGRLSGDRFDLVHDFEEAALSITASKDSMIWLATDSKLLRLGEDDLITTVAELPADLKVNTIFEDRDRALWIGTQNSGLLRFKDGTFSKIATSHAWTDCISQDRDGNIWAGTVGGGLNLIKPRIVGLLDQSSGLPFTSIRSLTFDSAGQLWAVSQAGRLAHRDSDGWRYFNRGDDSDWINCVTADSRGNIWIGTRSRGLLCLSNGQEKRYGKKDGLAGLFVRSLLAARNGDLWIATHGPNRLHLLRNGKVSQIDHTGDFEALRALAEGADGTVWVGSSDGRLLSTVGGKLNDEPAVEDIPSIRTLHTTSDGSLWIGYAGEGLGHLKDGKYTRITSADGLYNDYISQIQDDGEGSLWIASNRGLFLVDLEEALAFRSSKPRKIRCRAFGRSDGLPSFQPSRDYHPASSRGPDHRLYFSSSNGIVEARPAELRGESLAPPVVLESVTLDGKLKAFHEARSMHGPEEADGTIDLSKPDSRMTLPPGHDRLVISFAALSMASPENVGFRYRLEPLDKDWEEPDQSRSATFTRLPAGSYDFKVIACNSEGVWNTVGASLRIVVQPFFWQTWWFRIGGGVFTALLAGGLVFMGLRRKHQRQLRRLAAKRALEDERSRIARDIHDDLGASLTRISLLSQSTDNPGEESTNNVLNQIQSTARHLMRSMDGVVWAINPEHDTFDDLANYVSSYSQEFLNVAGIRCRLSMPVDLPELPLSAQLRHNLFLAFKEALNNVVKYAGATEVRVSLEPKDGFFVLRIQDNGGGIDPNAPVAPERSNAGNGLANMERRMEEIGGSCVLRSAPEHGTTVEFSIPFRLDP